MERGKAEKKYWEIPKVLLPYQQNNIMVILAGKAERRKKYKEI